jgi:serine/threonine protein kinase
MNGGGFRSIGPWTLESKLGAGGNATVWRATRDATEGCVALKVVNTAKASKEPYKRFVQEIEFLRSAEDMSGVLPVIDTYLPEEPSPDDRPWLAMPIAQGIDKALAGQDLDVVVTAIGQIATTLDRLAREHEVGHRDIKPGNLYELDGNWLVGDFGLIAAPDIEELARTGQPLGPAHYTAYELITDGAHANPHPADVFSLGKTLWVLATEQSFPPQGHQPADSRGFNLQELRPHRGAAALDRLIDQCTRLNASDRPSVAQVTSDLEAWHDIAAKSPAFDIGDLDGRLRNALTGELATRDARARLKADWLEAVQRHVQLMEPIQNVLLEAHPGAILDAIDDALTRNTMRTMVETGATEILERWQNCIKLPTGPDYSQYVLRCGRGIEIDSQGQLILHAFVDVGDPESSLQDYYWMADIRMAPAGSIKADQMIAESVDEIGVKLKEALVAFADGVAGRT